MKVFDCCIFYDEYDLLELRINELYDIVDYFIVVEGTETFTNQPKPLFLQQELNNRFVNFKHKIRNITINDMPKMINGNRWPQERYSFNKIIDGLYDVDKNDIVMISAIDEIPNRNILNTAFEMVNILQDHVCLEQKLYYYFINCLANIPFTGTVITLPKILDEPNSLIYNRRNWHTIENGGWHFSFLGGIEAIIKKLESFSHSEYDNDYFKDKNKLLTHIKNGTDLFERNISFQFVEVDNTYPKFITQNINQFSKYIYTEKK